MTKELCRVGILGVGSCVPEKVMTNEELQKMVDTSDEWIVKRTGIHERRILGEQESILTLAVDAAKAALKNAGISGDKIGLILVTTATPDYYSPSIASRIQIPIGVGNCAAFDLNAACTGFLYALDIAEKYLTQDKSNVLIISAEVVSKRVDWQDRRTCVLFGDGAGACVATKGDSLKYLNLTVQGDSKTINSPIGTGNSPFISEQK